jgi:hypothetical protein
MFGSVYQDLIFLSPYFEKITSVFFSKWRLSKSNLNQKAPWNLRTLSVSIRDHWGHQTVKTARIRY